MPRIEDAGVEVTHASERSQIRYEVALRRIDQAGTCRGPRRRQVEPPRAVHPEGDDILRVPGVWIGRSRDALHQSDRRLEAARSPAACRRIGAPVEAARAPLPARDPDACVSRIARRRAPPSISAKVVASSVSGSMTIEGPAPTTHVLSRACRRSGWAPKSKHSVLCITPPGRRWTAASPPRRRVRPLLRDRQAGSPRRWRTGQARLHRLQAGQYRQRPRGPPIQEVARVRPPCLLLLASISAAGRSRCRDGEVAGIESDRRSPSDPVRYLRDAIGLEAPHQPARGGEAGARCIPDLVTTSPASSASSRTAAARAASFGSRTSAPPAPGRPRPRLPRGTRRREETGSPGRAGARAPRHHGPGPGCDHGRRGPDLPRRRSARRILAGAGGRGPPSSSASSPFTGASPRLPWERMEDVERRIRDAIGDRGPITFAEFELALHSPGASTTPSPWARKPPPRPHVADAFALLVSEALRRMWTQSGCPELFRVVEVGADGTLARQRSSSSFTICRSTTPPSSAVRERARRSQGSRASVSRSG